MVCQIRSLPGMISKSQCGVLHILNNSTFIENLSGTGVTLQECILLISVIADDMYLRALLIHTMEYLHWHWSQPLEYHYFSF